MRYCSLLLLAVALLLSLSTAPVRAGDTKEAALAAAHEWLATVDAGQYDQGWQTAAKFLQRAIPKATFSGQLQAVRTPLGAVKSRKLTSSTSATTLPGAPDGHYWVFQFQTTFAGKASAIETITPMLEGGAWKVSGYFIR